MEVLAEEGVPMKVVVVGGRGLIAREVWSLLSQDPRFDLHVAGRQRPSGLPSSVRFTPIDLVQDASRLDGVFDGAAIIVNASSFVGDDPATQQAVNSGGVRTIVAAAERSGSAPLVQISTAGVYGTTREQGGTEGAYEVSPESPLSQSRADGDAIASAYGASILRPLFVTGAGDRHFLLPLLQAHLALGAWVEGGAARVSVVHASFVAEVVKFAIDRHAAGDSVHLVHVVTPTTVTIRELLEPVLECAGRSLGESISLDEAIGRAAPMGIPARKIAQFASDFFLSSRVLPASLSGAAAPPLSASDIGWCFSQLAAGAGPQTSPIRE